MNCETLVFLALASFFTLSGILSLFTDVAHPHKNVSENFAGLSSASHECGQSKLKDAGMFQKTIDHTGWLSREGEFPYQVCTKLIKEFQVLFSLWQKQISESYLNAAATGGGD